MSSEALVEVLTETRTMLARPNNDFSWSRWKDGEAAVAEIDAILGRIEAAETIKLLPLQALYGPTGSLQEVSIESGWADDFMKLASRFDDAIRIYEHERQLTTQRRSLASAQRASVAKTIITGFDIQPMDLPAGAETALFANGLQFGIVFGDER